MASKTLSLILEPDKDFYCEVCSKLCEGEPETVDNRSVCGACYDALEVCENCDNTVFDKTTLTDITGELWCEDCRDDYAFQCADCDEWHSNDFACEVSDWRGHTVTVCEDCRDEDYGFCETCEVYFPANVIQYSDLLSAHYCESCYSARLTVCSNCSTELEREGDYTYYTDYDVYCEECFNESYTYCDECGETVYREDCQCDSEGENSYCPHCYDALHPRSGRIHDHSFKPQPDFKVTDKEVVRRTKPFFGIELEIEYNACHNTRELCDAIGDTYSDLLYLKEDGSLSHGVELVFHPVSFPYFKKNHERFETLLDTLREKGCASYKPGTCGIHVHISRKAFTTLHLFKFLSFFYSEENYAPILAVSQRQERQLNQWSGMKGQTRNDQIKKLKQEFRDRARAPRYTAVNLQNSGTIEVRIFRGTLKTGSFFKDLEFTKAVYDFTDEYGVKDMTWEKFCAFVQEHKKTFVNLDTFLTLKNLYKN